jgi:hypothetical protein
MDPQNQVPMGTLSPMGEGIAAGVSTVAISPRSKRLRWGIASAVVVTVMVATVAGAFALAGAAGARSLTAGAAPKGTVAFMEVRVDLPGDQHAKLADFMSHFPGFMDRAQFDNALDEMLNKLTSSVSSDLRYTSAFKPWMEGEVSIAVTDLGAVDFSGMGGMMDDIGAAFPSGAEGMGGMMPSLALPTRTNTGMTRAPGVVAIFALKDRAGAEAWASAEIARTGLTVTTSTYAGTEIKTTGSGSLATAYALTDKDLLLGTVEGVKASLDSATKGSLNDNANYQAAMKALSGDSLARFYIDARGLVSYYMDTVNGMMGAFAIPSASAFPTLSISTKDIPAWIAGSVRAESDRMVVDWAMPRVKDAGTGNHTSRLASALPGSTVAAMEIHSIGKSITDQLNSLDASVLGTAGAGDQLKAVKDALSKFGGIDWLGDGVAVMTKNGSTYGGGIVVEATDAATAKAKAASILNLATLAGGALGLTSRDETYKGIDITIVKMTSTAPEGIAPAPPLEVAVAVKDNMIVAGYTDAFVKAVIDTTPATSLASASDYSAVMSAAGSSNQEWAYVNIPAVVDQIGQSVISSDRARWTQDFKPYFDHLGGVGFSMIDGNTVILRLVVMAK